MKKLFVFVILLLVVGVSSMAATFYHRPRHMGYMMNGESQYHNFGMYERTYNRDYCSNNYYSDGYDNGGNRGYCHSGSIWY